MSIRSMIESKLPGGSVKAESAKPAGQFYGGTGTGVEESKARFYQPDDAALKRQAALEAWAAAGYPLHMPREAEREETK